MLIWRVDANQKHQYVNLERHTKTHGNKMIKRATKNNITYPVHRAETVCINIKDTSGINSNI